MCYVCVGADYWCFVFCSCRWMKSSLQKSIPVISGLDRLLLFLLKTYQGQIPPLITQAKRKLWLVSYASTPSWAGLMQRSLIHKRKRSRGLKHTHMNVSLSLLRIILISASMITGWNISWFFFCCETYKLFLHPDGAATIAPTATILSCLHCG